MDNQTVKQKGQLTSLSRNFLPGSFSVRDFLYKKSGKYLSGFALKYATNSLRILSATFNS
jgi:hypothetical protein